MKNFFKRLFHSSSLLFICANIAFAENIGTAAEELTVPLGLFSDFVYKLCYVVGAVLVVGGLVQYKKYRDNPTAVPLSTPITMIVLGLAIGLLPLVPTFLATNTGVKYMPNTPPSY